MDELLNTAPCGFFSFTDDGALVAANDTLAGMLGYASGELVGSRVESLLTLASRMFYQTHLFPLIRMHGKAEEIFLSLRSRNGESIPVLLNAVRKEREGAAVNQCALIPVRNRGKYEDELLAAKRVAEEALRSNEELIRARQELELHARELDRKLLRLEQKNQELTRLSTILAHDLREPIRKLSMFSSLFTQQDREGLSVTGQRSLDRIKVQSARMEQLVLALQEFVSLDETHEPLEEVDLSDVMGNARQLVAERTGMGFELHSGPLPVLQGRRRQLMMLFFQLIDNAVKFRRPEELPRIDIESYLIQHNSYRANTGKYHYTDFARIVFADNGKGFDNRYSDYVFEALRKLDPDSPGQGIGLAIGRKVVENHNGSISVESEPGRGTRFTLLLPLRQ
ncbi:sensor histidine kinase [Archangium gephyra]|uniref:sensor histidine kinase n=1 Tax=Archangium gephyra TaxID=48 RepID=UPI003B7D10C2